MKNFRVGVDLGATGIKAGIVDKGYHIIRKAEMPARHQGRSPYDVIDDIAVLTRQLIKDAVIHEDEIEGIGVGCPGTVDALRSMIVYSNNIQWENVCIGTILEEKFDCVYPVRISNDANCAALGEIKAGTAKGCKNAIMITLGTGVGGGIIINGEIFEGGYPGGAEIGHMMLQKEGRLCSCGRKGCLEAYCSATALISRSVEAAKEHPDSLMNTLCKGDISHNMNGKIPFDAAREKDMIAKQVISDYLDDLSEGIIDLINVFRPEKVIIGGGISKEGNSLSNELNHRIHGRTFGKEKAVTAEIVCAKLGNDAGICGAAALFSESLV